MMIAPIFGSAAASRTVRAIQLVDVPDQLPIGDSGPLIAMMNVEPSLIGSGCLGAAAALPVFALGKEIFGF